MDEQNEQPPSYDSTLKEFIREQIADILPILLEGAVYEQELTVEVMRPTMRADKVFTAQYRERRHIIHLEFQATSDPDIQYRVLIYNAGIVWDYKLPVISIIIYLFPSSMPKSPLLVLSGSEELIKFSFRTLPLWKWNAVEYVQKHLVSMYPLLPTMNGASAAVLLQAIKELAERYRHEENKLSRQLLWMGILLRRSETVKPEDKARVEERLNMFENLWEEDPKIQKYLAIREAEKVAKAQLEGLSQGRAEGRVEGRVEGRAEGVVEGEILTMRKTIVKLVARRFPSLGEFALSQVWKLGNLDALDQLFERISDAEDEKTVLLLLNDAKA